jgi:hypothetical protein
LPTGSLLIDGEEGERVRSIGLDVHRDFCEVAIVEAGEVRSAGRIETTPATLELFAQSLCASDRVVLEVTGNAWEIARILGPHVGQVLVVRPGDTGIRQARAKTDRLDARALAKLLAAGSLDGLWMPDEQTRALRRRLARRSQPVRARDPGEERVSRGAGSAADHQAGGQRPVRRRRPPLAPRARVAGRGARDGRRLPAPDRVPRPGGRRAREAGRPRRARLGADQAADDRAGRERDRRRDVSCRGR